MCLSRDLLRSLTLSSKTNRCQHGGPVLQTVCSPILEELDHSIQAQTRESARLVSFMGCLLCCTAEFAAMRPAPDRVRRYVRFTFVKDTVNVWCSLSCRRSDLPREDQQCVSAFLEHTFLSLAI